MPAIALIVKNALGALLMYFAKRYAAELVYDAAVEAGDKLAKSTEFTNIDDDVIDKLKKDRTAALKIIKGFI